VYTVMYKTALWLLLTDHTLYMCHCWHQGHSSATESVDEGNQMQSSLVKLTDLHLQSEFHLLQDRCLVVLTTKQCSSLLGKNRTSYKVKYYPLAKHYQSFKSFYMWNIHYSLELHCSHLQNVDIKCILVNEIIDLMQ
jgi:hypothetical protein